MAAIFLLVVALTTVVVGQDEIRQPPSVIMTEPDFVIKRKFNAAPFGFVCRATGIPKPTITWHLNGTKITGDRSHSVDPEGTLMFQKMDPLYQGQYQCKAVNSFGVSQSNMTKLDMAFFDDFPTNPVIIPTTPVDEGKPLQLKCEYADPFSNPKPIWKWVHQNEVGVTNPEQNTLFFNGRLSVDPRGNLYFQHVLSSDNPLNWYHLCEAFNSIVSTKKSGSPHQIKINSVANIPDLTPKLVYNNGPDVEVVAGEDIELFCIFEGYPTVLVKWEKLGNDPMTIVEYQNGKTKLVMKESKNDNRFEGKYRCQGYQNDRVEPVTGASVTFNVSVLEKPRFLSGPVNTNVTVGGDIEVTCLAVAEPPAEYSWFINGDPIASLKTDLRRTVTGNTFKLTGLRRGTTILDSDLQVLTCMARNTKNGVEIGRSYMDGYINVVSAMSFVMQPKNHNVTDSTEKLVLDCEVASDPSITPQISWHYKQTPVTLAIGKLEQASNDSLIIYPKSFDNLDQVVGKYMCVAETFIPPDRITVIVNVTREDSGGVLPVTAAAINLWWIGLILALLILLIIIVLIICCIRRRNQGETHNVDKVERQMGNDPVKDLNANGFKDYTPREKGPIEGKRQQELEDFSLDEIDNKGYNEDNDSLGQYATDNYPGEFGVVSGRHNPSYDTSQYDQSGYGAPGYGGPINTGYVPDEADA